MTALQIVTAVAAKHGFPPESLKRNSKNSQHHRKVLARREAMTAIRREFGWSYPKIGKYFGGYHHTTVIDAVRHCNGQPVGAIGANSKPRGFTNRQVLRELEILRRELQVLVSGLNAAKETMPTTSR